MTVQQQFDEGMTAEEKFNHVRMWIDDLTSKGFMIDLTLFVLNHTTKTCAFLPIPKDEYTLNHYENALGYRITATSLNQ